MGPSARAGKIGRIMEADFATLDDALEALHDDAFAEVKSATESFGSTLFLYELSNLEPLTAAGRHRHPKFLGLPQHPRDHHAQRTDRS